MRLCFGFLVRDGMPGLWELRVLAVFRVREQAFLALNRDSLLENRACLMFFAVGRVRRGLGGARVWPPAWLGPFPA